MSSATTGSVSQPAAPTRRRLRRILRWFKATVWLALLAWFCRYAYVRSTTRPPGAPPWQDVISVWTPRSGIDVGKKLTEAWRALPSPPYPYFDPVYAIYGSWDLAERPILQDIIRYLELPRTRAALDSAHELSRGACVLDVDTGGYQALHSTVKYLVARARYRWEGLGQFDAAIADLVTSLHLALRQYERPSLISQMIANACDASTCTEIRHMLLDGRIPLHSLETLHANLKPLVLPEIPVLLPAVIHEQRFAVSQLDAYYTKVDPESGWLDIEALAQNKGTAAPAAALTRAGGLWNLFSPLFCSRHDVTEKVRGIWAETERLDGLLGSEAFAQLERMRHLTDSVTEFDGPLYEELVFFFSEVTFARMIRAIMERQATQTILAIERYRRQHDGAPPDSLTDLVPDYLEWLPFDWYGDGPMRYRQTDEGYVLYSVNADGVDDGGVMDAVKAWHNSPDYVFTMPRRRALDESGLVQARFSAVWPDEEEEAEDAGQPEAEP